MISRRTRSNRTDLRFRSRFYTVTFTKIHKCTLHCNRRLINIRFKTNFSHDSKEKHFSQHFHDNTVYFCCHIGILGKSGNRLPARFVHKHQFGLYRLQNSVHIIRTNKISYSQAMGLCNHMDILYGRVILAPSGEFFY